MPTYEQAATVADLLDVEPAGAGPTEDDLREMRAVLEADLNEVTAGWVDRPQSPLRLTKARLRSTAMCSAQILAEADPFELDSDVALGAICDIASGVVAAHPTYRPASSWLDDLRATLMAERRDVLEFVEGLGGEQLEVFTETVDERCERLGPLLGDLRAASLTVRERSRVTFKGAGVLLTGETDMAVGTKSVVLVEVKSGGFGPGVASELRHYMLVRALRDLRAPSFGCAVTLADGQMTPLPVRLDELHTAARQVIAAAEAMVEVDQCVAEGRPVPTKSGGHCRWCRRARVCPDVSDSVLSELPVGTSRQEWSE